MNESITAKYRPSLTSQQISYIVDLCERESRSELQSMAAELSKQLKIFALKSQLGIVSAAFIAAPRQSVEDKLELNILLLSEQRELAYRKWHGNPSLCTAKEIAMAATYRYENGMMTPDEESRYESAS